MFIRLTYKRFVISIVLIFGIIFSSNLFAQDSPKSKKKLQILASEYFNNEEFSKALPLYLTLDSLIPDNFEIKYYIGACYLNTPYEKTKGISYLEFALKNGSNLSLMLFFTISVHFTI